MGYIGNFPASTQTVDLKWQPIKTASFTAVAGEGYFVNTFSAAVTVTLPASPQRGDTIQIVDYSRTFGTNNLTVNVNSNNFQGYSTVNPVYSTAGSVITCVYSDSTKGWIVTEDDDATWKTRSGQASYTVDFLCIAGGGGGGKGTPSAHVRGGGGGGAGGYRNSFGSESSGANSSSETALTFSGGTTYTITVGAGGAGTTSAGTDGTSGSDSSISGSDITDIVSTGGGGGGGGSRDGLDGGSGGGGGSKDGTSSGG